MKEVTIYTDGRCTGNPGIGGWGCILIYGEHSRERSGYSPESTCRRMELYAAIEGLFSLKSSCNVILYSNSDYLVDAFQNHQPESWMLSGWHSASNQSVENTDLWKVLMMLVQRHNVEFKKMSCRQNDLFVNRCDELAEKEIQSKRSGF